MNDLFVSRETLARGTAAWNLDPRIEDVDAALARVLSAMGMTVEGHEVPLDVDPPAPMTDSARATVRAIEAEDGASLSIAGSAVTIRNNATGQIAMTYDAGTVDLSLAYAVAAHPPGSELREISDEA